MWRIYKVPKPGEWERKAAGIKLDKAAYKKYVTELKAKYYASSTIQENMSKLVHTEWIDRNAGAVRTSEDESDDEDDLFELHNSGKVFETFLDVYGSKKAPFEPEYYDMAVKKLLGIDDSSAMPGLTPYARQFRKEQLPNLFQADEGATHRA